MTKVDLPFLPGARVKIDGDPTVVGRVTAYNFRPALTQLGLFMGHCVTCEVSYIHNGVDQVKSFESWRLEEVT